MIKSEIIKLLENVISELGISDIEPVIERPADITHGDYSTNIALVAAKKLGKPPRELAENIVQKLHATRYTLHAFDKIEVAGPGFINFWVSKKELSNNLDRLLREDEKIADIGKGRKVVVEYSSPNIAKPFTVGHLRSTIIGDAIANLLEAVGYTVYRDSHVGDWGTQFGKQIYAIRTWGDEAEIENSDTPVKLLVDLYIKFHTEAEANPKLEDEARLWFKKLEDGDSEVRRLWQKCTEWSWKEFDAIYQKLDIKFTENEGRGYGESYFEDKMGSVISELQEKGLLKEGKEGAQIVEFDIKTKLPPLMILKNDGATLYSTRDLATDKFRLDKYGKDLVIINEVGAEQSLYFQQLYALEEMLGWYRKDQRVHVRHGLYRFKDEKMSTRRGNVIWLEDVLEEAERRAYSLTKDESRKDKKEHNKRNRFEHLLNHQEAENLSKQISIGALKWNDLKRDSKQDIVFDWDDILSMEGNSGPYLQYTYARTQSVLRKAGERSYQLSVISHQLTDEEMNLLRLLYFFDESVIEAAEKYSPNIVANYLYNLAQAFNLFYQKHSILNPESVIPSEASPKAGEVEGSLANASIDDIKQFRLALTEAVGKTIKKGLYLLGIEAPERM